MARFAWLNDFKDLRPGGETLHFAPAKSGPLPAKSGPLFLLVFLCPQGVARARMTLSISRHFPDVARLSTTRRFRNHSEMAPQGVRVAQNGLGVNAAEKID